MRESLEELILGLVLIPGRRYEKLVFSFLRRVWVDDGLWLPHGNRWWWWCGRCRGFRRIWKIRVRHVLMSKRALVGSRSDTYRCGGKGRWGSAEKGYRSMEPQGDQGRIGSR